jgi:hypothetical protein
MLVRAARSGEHRKPIVVVEEAFEVAERVGSRTWGGEEVLERALRALDLAGEHGLLAHVHEREDVGVGQRQHRTVDRDAYS